MLSYLSLHSLSLMTGLTAWVFGTCAVTEKKETKIHGFSVGSLCMCSIALVLQLIEIGRLVEKNDLSAIMDTIGAVIIAAMVLVVVTMLLNVVALLKVGAQNKMRSSR